MASIDDLPLPRSLTEIMTSGRWVQPPDSTIRRIIPWLQGPVDFLLSEEQIRGQSQASLDAILGDSLLDEHSREYRGSRIPERDLPWLDSEKALFLAVNRDIGGDLGIALDYRRSEDAPRVVASYWGNDGCSWKEIASGFASFAEMLDL